MFLARLGRSQWLFCSGCIDYHWLLYLLPLLLGCCSDLTVESNHLTHVYCLSYSCFLLILIWTKLTIFRIVVRTVCTFRLWSKSGHFFYIPPRVWALQDSIAIPKGYNALLAQYSRCITRTRLTRGKYWLHILHFVVHAGLPRQESSFGQEPHCGCLRGSENGGSNVL